MKTTQSVWLTMVLLAPMAIATGSTPSTASDMARPDLLTRTCDALGISAGTLISLEIDAAAAPPSTLDLSLPDGRLLSLQRHSVRSETYTVTRIDERGIETITHSAGAARTYRGTWRDARGPTSPVHASHVAAALLPDGLHAMVHSIDGETTWIQPVPASVAAIASAAPAGANGVTHILYDTEDIIPGTADTAPCGALPSPFASTVQDVIDASARPATHGTPSTRATRHPAESAPLAGATGGPCIAQLAIDTDFELFQGLGSVSAVQNFIEMIVNAVNVQFETETGITHVIETIVVRAAEPDPYTASDASTLLCQFMNVWSGPQGAVERDATLLITGRNLVGPIIGMPTVNGRVCENTGTCVASGAYALIESIAPTLCLTDLVAHQLGHLWGAAHCSCPGTTMHAASSCTNTFAPESIDAIIATRDAATCLDQCNTCPLDLDGTGDVGFSDILMLVAAWGPCAGCPADADGNGTVGFSDVLMVIGAWGPC